MRRCFLLLSVVVTACDGATASPDAGDAAEDGGDVDGGAGDTDGGSIPDGAVTDPDAGMMSCDPGQHACGDGCIDLLPNNPSNGCALGCGEACPVADATCTPDGLCGTETCVPMTCEDFDATCGTIEQGCGMGRRSCGACDTAGGERCADGTCAVVCSADLREGASDNNTPARAQSLGTLTDEPDSSLSVTNATIHAATDEDWYRITVDNSSTGFGSPEVYVTLRGLPAGEDYDLGAWYECSSGGPSGCRTGGGSLDTSIASGGCVSVNVGGDHVAFNSDCGDDFGTLYIRVHPAGWDGSCDSYALDVEIN